MTFKVGDWGFYEFKLVQIDEIRDGRITNVRDGYFEMGGYDMMVLPLTLKNKVWSEEFSALRHKIHKEGSSGLNYPDIQRKLVAMWLETCENAADKIPPRTPKEVYDEASDFVKKVLEAQRAAEVDGMKLFKQ